MYLLDVEKGELETAKDLMRVREDVNWNDSYSHPSDGRYERFEFEHKSARDDALDILRSYDIETFPMTFI